MIAPALRSCLATLALFCACRPDPPPRLQPAASFDVQGHRGDRGNVPPGNTLESFRSALELGVDTLEADMQISADGQIVMGHDDDLHETSCVWAGEGSEPSSRISELSVTQIASWDCHAELQGVQPPPLLAEALELDRRVQLNLELKRTSEADADIYLRALIEYQQRCDACLSGRLTLQSFEWSALRYARASYGEQLEFRAAILDKRGDIEAIDAARGYAQIWSPKHELVSAELVARAHELGMLAIPWTVNDERRMRELIDMGVDGIITDFPDVLLAVLGRAQR
jgi:glycerophosphoryl diester phosphodiesterase